MDEGKPVNHKQLIENVAGHIDHFNPNNFQAKDLENLIQSATKDLENYDEKRHEQFKQYEMEKAVEREEKLKNMNEYERAKAMEEEKKRRERHNKHEKIPHPVSFFLKFLKKNIIECRILTFYFQSFRKSSFLTSGISLII